MMRVSKFDAWGNDFLVLDVAQLRSAGVDEAAVAWPEVSRAWCNRASGIGADGLLLLERIDDVDARMRLYNSDGSTAEMSGNGARCFAHALFRSDAARGERVYRLHTDAGVREVTVGEQDSNLVVATVDMGEVSTIDAPANWAAIGTHPDRPVVHVSVGNPHTVVGVDDVDSVDIGQLGRQVPQVNLEIIAPGPGRNAITMRVHERGAGITQACGTGACASAWAALRWGLVSSTAERVEVTVHMLGGDAVVTLNAPEAGRVALTGPAQYVDSYDASLEAPYSVTAPRNT
jgi:diaminopimelate epimerase